MKSESILIEKAPQDTLKVFNPLLIPLAEHSFSDIDWKCSWIRYEFQELGRDGIFDGEIIQKKPCCKSVTGFKTQIQGMWMRFNKQSLLRLSICAVSHLWLNQDGEWVEYNFIY